MFTGKDAQKWVRNVKQLGFDKATVIKRSNYMTEAYSSQVDIATAWMSGSKQINENQSLLDSWKYENKEYFCFYGIKFNVIDTRDISTSDESERNATLKKNCQIIVNYWYCQSKNNSELFIPKELISIVYSYCKYVIKIADFNSIIGENEGKNRLVCAFQSKYHWFIASSPLNKMTTKFGTAIKTTTKPVSNNSKSKNSSDKPDIDDEKAKSKPKSFDSAIAAFETLYDAEWDKINQDYPCRKDSSHSVQQYPRKKNS